MMDSKSVSDINEAAKYDMETDISQMEAPTFTTIDRSNPASMLALDWDHKVNLVGKKVLNPMIHCCDKCLKPILIYGRMIPCKHVFCLGCAKEEERTCPRCGDKVNRVEQAGLGNIFLCTQGGSRYGNTGCRRTYLSSRDLAAHVAHRHKEKGAKETTDHKVTSDHKLGDLAGPLANISKASLASVVAAVNNAAGSTAAGGGYPQTTGYNQSYPQTDISVHNTRPGNLITIHTQETTGQSPASCPTPGQSTPGATPGYTPGYSTGGYPAYTPSSAPAAGYPNMSQPPPSFGYQAAGYTAPPAATGYQSYTAPTGQTPGYTTTTGQSTGFAGSQVGSTSGYNTTNTQYGGAANQGGPPPAGYGGGQWNRPPPGQQGYFRR